MVFLKELFEKVILKKSSTDDKRHAKIFQHAIYCRYGSTNVHKALSIAVSLHSPTFAFPVRCLETFRSISKGQQQHKETDILRDCISLKPGSTVEDLYNVLLHYPTQLLTGEFVRAEVSSTVEDLYNVLLHYPTQLLTGEFVRAEVSSTVEDLYNVLLHYPTQLLTGEFVRAEIRSL